MAAISPAATGVARTRKHVATAPVEKQQVSLNLFGMPLGLTGLAGCWSAAVTALHAPTWPSDVLFGAGAILWLILTALYVGSGARRTGMFQADLKHPLSGPFAAYIPLIGILLAAHYSVLYPAVGAWVCTICIVFLAIVAARLFAHWVAGGVPLDAVHPGYFVPVVAGANVASIGFSSIGAHDAALAAFGAGLFFWLMIGTVVLIRLMMGDHLPDPLKPAMTAFLAAAATSNLAWLVAHPGELDEVQHVLIGVLVFMLIVQVILISEYRKLSFGPSWWIFTFPMASTANFSIHWAAASTVQGWPIYAWAALGVVTTFVLFVGTRTVVSALSPSGRNRRVGKALATG